MSELKVHRIIGLDGRCNRVDNDYYLKAEADEVIAEKDAEIARLKAIRKVHIESIESMCEGLKLNAKQICKTQRALWLARAERALEKIAWFKLWNASISTMNPEDGARQEFDKWKKNLGKFLKNAEEYK